MILRRSRRFTVQMAEYETYSFGADVEMSHKDLGVSDEELATMSVSDYTALRDNLTTAVLEELFVQLDEDIERTAHQTENRHSFIRRARRLVKLMDGAATPEPPPQATATTAKTKTIARKAR